MKAKWKENYSTCIKEKNLHYNMKGDKQEEENNMY